MPTFSLYFLRIHHGLELWQLTIQSFRKLIFLMTNRGEFPKNTHWLSTIMTIQKVKKKGRSSLWKSRPCCLCEDFIFPFFTTALVICQQIIIHLYIPFLAVGYHSFYRTSIVQSKTCNTHEPYGTSSSWNNNFLPKLNKLIMFKVHGFSLAKLSDNDRLQSISLSWHIQHI